MVDNLVVDAAEEELEAVSTNQNRGTWNDRQPTPDPLESNDGNDNNQFVEGRGENDNNMNDVEPRPSANIIEPSNVLQNSLGGTNGALSLEPTNTIDDDVFGEFESYKEDDGQWLRKAISACSEGDDIQLLASEAGDFPYEHSFDSSCKLDVVIATDASLDTIVASSTDTDIIPDTRVDASTAVHASNNTDANGADSSIATADASIIHSTADNPNLATLRYPDENEAIDNVIDDEALIDKLCDLPVLCDTLIDDDTGVLQSGPLNSFAQNSSDEMKQLPSSGGEEHSHEDSKSLNLKDSDFRNDETVGIINEISSDSNMKEPSALGDKNRNENDTHLLTDQVKEIAPTHKNEQFSCDVNDNCADENSCDLDKEERFAIILDEKMKRRIQRAIESDDYVYQSSLAMSEAIDLEQQKQFKASFKLYKLGIGILLQGVKQDNEEERRIAVRRKTAQYLLRAENVYKCCLMQAEQTAKARKRPIRLSECRTVGIIDKVMLVERFETGDIFVLKVLHKCGAEYKNRKEANSKGGRRFFDSKFMVKLFHQTESTTGIHLFLEYVCGGLLWNYLGMDLSWDSASIGMTVNRSPFTHDSMKNSRTSLPGSCSNLELTDSKGSMMEERIRIWMAEIVSVLSDLHRHSIICRYVVYYKYNTI